MNRSPLFIQDVTGRLRCRRIAPLLVPYADDRLRRAERERVEAHLLRCAACRAEAQTIAGVGALLRDAFQNAPAPVADLSPNLWAGIEAEIRRGGVPLDRSSESPMLRPRRRAGFTWDAAWPNSLPVAAAVFSAVVFGTALLNHHALTNSTHLAAPTASGDAQVARSIAVAIRPSAPAASAAAPAAVAPVSLALAKTSAITAMRSSIAASARRFVPTASKRTLVAALTPPAVAPKASAPFALAAAASPHAAPILAPRISTAIVTMTKTPLAPTSAASALDAEKPTYFADTARSADDGSRSDVSTLPVAKPKEASDAVAFAGTTETSTMNAPSYAPASAAKPSDDDATVRSDAPSDQPMADFAAISRRQRSLFSYTSR